MSELLTEAAKNRVRDAVAAIERKSSAEIVVVLRPASGRYRAADLTFGAIAALVVLGVFLYAPEPFDFTFFPIEQAAAFVLGALACAHAPPLRRALTRRAEREENVLRAARAAFVERGVARTTSRRGVLVYLSAFERDAAVVTDVGLDVRCLGAAFEEAKGALRSAKRDARLDAFVAALAQLGEALAAAYPARGTDEHELPDEVAA